MFLIFQLKKKIIFFIKKNQFNFITLIFFLLILINLKLIKNLLKLNFINFDIDLSTSTDLEDLYIIISDSLEVIFCDFNLLFDGFLDIYFFFIYKKIFNFIIKNLR
jgi:hypothetical protein